MRNATAGIEKEIDKQMNSMTMERHFETTLGYFGHIDGVTISSNSEEFHNLFGTMTSYLHAMSHMYSGVMYLPIPGYFQ